MSSNIDTTQFNSHPHSGVCIANSELDHVNDTDVIKSLKSKQSELESPNTVELESPNTPESPVKSNRGRKRKYATDEDRILARRAQQRAYRERKKLELIELRLLRDKLESAKD